MSRPRSHRDGIRQHRSIESADVVDLVEVGGVFVTAEKAQSREAGGLVMDLLSLVAAPWRMLGLSDARWQLFESASGRRAAALRLAPVFLAVACLRYATDGIMAGKEHTALGTIFFVLMLSLASRLSWSLSARVTLIYMAVSIGADLMKTAISMASLHLWAGFSQAQGIFPMWEVLATSIAVVCMVLKTARSQQPEVMSP